MEYLCGVINGEKEKAEWQMFCITCARFQEITESDPANPTI
jgi:hypothetical protein